MAPIRAAGPVTDLGRVTSLPARYWAVDVASVEEAVFPPPVVGWMTTVRVEVAVRPFWSVAT